MFTGIMFFGVGQAIPSGSYMSAAGKVTDAGLFMKHVALHAAVGCVTSAAGGGKCAAGAASAGFAKFATPVSAGLGPVGGTISSAIVGGTASELGGGKFANGAVTGAFGYIFNHLSQAARARLIGAGAFLGGSAGYVAAGACTAGTGGVCALGTPAFVGAGAAAGGALGTGLANLVDWADGLIFNESENTNPYNGPVSEPVVVVDQNGNAIPVGKGQQVKTSPNGDYQQVVGADGKPTGDRMDRGGHKGQKDPRAQGPHGHRPGVTTPDGNPHLPIR